MMNVLQQTGIISDYAIKFSRWQHPAQCLAIYPQTITPGQNPQIRVRVKGQ